MEELPSLVAHALAPEFALADVPAGTSANVTTVLHTPASSAVNPVRAHYRKANDAHRSVFGCDGRRVWVVG
ncbi:hypothetical protein [Antrihabitans spumae]|uniref:Uncharacterized protein n=1 Tax=Antrihabitans spumae TaxID=3373370 RepID=A0ABW7KGY4_9NOCA